MAHLAHYKEAHPFEFVVTHWINLVSMIVLILSGFLIHYPFIAVSMSVLRGMHIFFGILLFVNLLVRIVLAFFVGSAPTGGTRKQVKDIYTWLPQKDNRHQFGAWIKYYLFFKKDHPLAAKLGVPQKLSYLGIPILILGMFYTGLALYGPTMDMPFFAAGVTFVGGAMNMRVIHYFGMFVFICFMLIHIYLANVEGFAPTFLMFIRREGPGLVYDPDLHNIIGKDEMLDKEETKA